MTRERTVKWIVSVFLNPCHPKCEGCLADAEGIYDAVVEDYKESIKNDNDTPDLEKGMA